MQIWGARMLRQSQVAKIVENLGIGPVLGADELTANHTTGIEDVRFRRTAGIEGLVRLLGEIEDGGDAGDVVIDEVLAVSVGVGIEAHGENDDVGQIALELDERGELLETGRAPAGPEVEDDDLAPILAETDGLGAIVNDDGGGRLADLGGMGGAVAAEKQGAGSRQQAVAGEAAEHVSIIRCRARGRPAAAAFRHHSRAQ